jgi:hypothetical protein
MPRVVDGKGHLMETLRGGNNWKAAGVLFVLAAFLGVMLVVPALRRAPVVAPVVDLPSLFNVPPPGGSHVQP